MLLLRSQDDGIRHLLHVLQFPKEIMALTKLG